ncbi:PREDICTED: probable plastid-lipid-associated protein 4, chloroplastic [Ipomoea nil]|uniref:probable plastid-lipid-associated protein 4, chloroplastic n=1 Tax=Ipomoea nil TaxID=35883 RepID=UPI000900C449|nr:PREDICTED: probable plastid-lipid-associated protein 4, chloroplastic [Ipomoea nil]
MAIPFSIALAPLYSGADHSSLTAKLSSRIILPASPKLHSGSTSTFHCWSESLKEQVPQYWKWRTRVSFSFLSRSQDVESLKDELLEAIAPLDRGANATPEDQKLVDQIARKLEAVNKVKEPLKSSLLNGQWELLYTTSESILQTRRPKVFRPNGKIYQAINVDTLRAQNMETWPFFNQATANLVPINAKRVAVKFDSFKIAGVIPINARGSGRGQIEITYLDEDLRITRGNQGNLFILRMVDPSYRVPI